MCGKALTLLLLVAALSAVARSSSSCEDPEVCSAQEPKQAEALLQAKSKHDPFLKSVNDAMLLEEDNQRVHGNASIDDSLPLRTDDVIYLKQGDHGSFIGAWGVVGGEVTAPASCGAHPTHGIYGYTSKETRTEWTVEVSGDDVYLFQKRHNSYLGFCGTTGSLCNKDNMYVFNFDAKTWRTKLRVEAIAGSKNVYVLNAEHNNYLGMCGSGAPAASGATYNVYGWEKADASLLQSQAAQSRVRTHFEIEFISRTTTTTTPPPPPPSTTEAPTTVAPTTVAAPTQPPPPTSGNVNPSGAAAPLDETGYAAVADRCCQAEMKQFIEREVVNQGMEVCEPAGLEGIVPYHSCELGVQTFAALTANILEDSAARCTWVANTGACKARPADCPSFSGAAPSADCGCSRSKAATVTLTAASVTQNNMQGKGPTTGPQELRYSNVGMTDTGVPFDVVVTVISTTPYSRTLDNGFSSGFGVLNLQNSATVKTADFRFAFVQPGTNTPVVVPEIHFATFDLDGDSAHGIETVSSKGYKGYVTDVTPSVVASKLPDGRTKFSSSQVVNNIPNPTDPNSLTTEQRANSIMYFFEDASTFDIEFGIEAGQNSRNLFFSFSSVLNDRCGA